MKYWKGGRALLVLLALSLMACFPALAYTGIGENASYTYDEKGNDVSIPDAYTFKTAFDLVDVDGLRAGHAQCMVLSEKTGRLYVADTDNNRILIYSADFRLEKVLTDFPYENDTLQLNQPEGIYVYDNGDLLVADTQNGRILQCREDGTVFKILEKPANMTGLTGGDEAFLPSRLAVDSIGRMYVVARNINRGIIQLDSEGRFMGYIGSPRVQYDVMTVLLRRFFTETQKAKLEQFVPTEYNSIFMDDEDFLWSTISSLDGEDILNAIRSKDKSGTVTPIKKLNTMGNDVLKRNGFYAPLGDLDFKEEPSRIVGVAVGQNGIYSLLDQQRGHIFTYDDNGNLLFIFGNIGNRKSDFQMPVDIRYQGDDLLVLDSGLGKVLVFQPTAYGQLVLQAEASQFNGDYEEAYKLWSQLAGENTNFKYAFVGLGNAMLKQGKYDAALKYFRYAEDQNRYSGTVALIREQKVQTYFPVIMGILISLGVLALLYSLIKRMVKYYKGSQE